MRRPVTFQLQSSLRPALLPSDAPEIAIFSVDPREILKAARQVLKIEPRILCEVIP
jgi:hypothetical protein